MALVENLDLQLVPMRELAFMHERRPDGTLNIWRERPRTLPDPFRFKTLHEAPGTVCSRGGCVTSNAPRHARLKLSKKRKYPDPLETPLDAPPVVLGSDDDCELKTGVNLICLGLNRVEPNRGS